MKDSSTAKEKSILLVDDMDECRILAKWLLSNFGYHVDGARSVEDALKIFDPAVHDLVVTDNSMPGLKGADLARIVKERSATTPVVMYTGNPPEDRSCIDRVIQKPAHLLTVKNAVDELLKK